MLPDSASKAHREIGAAGGFVLLLPDPPVTRWAGGYDGFSTWLTCRASRKCRGSFVLFLRISDHPSMSPHIYLCRAEGFRAL